VAAEWFTTTQIRRFFANLVNRMEQKFGEIVNDKMPAVVLSIVKTGASAFTPDTTYQISTTVNNYDAIGAVLASLETLGFMPNAIIMHPKAWRNMLQEKDTTGAYALQNGGSINIVGGGLDWGGFFIPYVKDSTLLVDEFIIGDLFSCVKAGVDSQLMYMETDGRTDENTSATSGLSRNIRTHVLEKFFAVIIPDATKAGIIKDTFANVKSLIVKP
jgi:hypothetical protein